MLSGDGQTPLTVAEYEAALVAQGGVCAICQTASPSSHWNADHDHKTGVFRGVLCESCNIGIGNFKDDIAIMKNAIGYLESSYHILEG